MNCLHPRSKTIVDSLTGERKTIVFPCGHCVNCQATFQDGWVIRLLETAKKYKAFVYDTLTIRPDAMSYDLLPTSPHSWSDFNAFRKIYPRCSKESYRLLQKNQFNVPIFPKKELQNWFKRGRERYKRFYGKRCDCCYFMVQEHGPRTSRPHFHILVFGLPFADYMKFFGQPWRVDFGWTKPSYILYSPESLKDNNCVVRYVAKYIVKDSHYFSPLVRDGFQEPPYRLISKGIGEGYLNDSRFDVFKSEEFNKWKSVGCPSDQQAHVKLLGLRPRGVLAQFNYRRYWASAKNNVRKALITKESGNGYLDLSVLSEFNLDSICLYYDNKGCVHKLPDYYKNKLLKNTNNEKNILQLEVQDVLQSRSRLLTNKAIQKSALALGIFFPDSELTKPCEDWNLPVGALTMVLNFYDSNERAESSISAERRKIKLDNHYRRGKLNKSPALQ